MNIHPVTASIFSTAIAPVITTSLPTTLLSCTVRSSCTILYSFCATIVKLSIIGIVSLVVWKFLKDDAYLSLQKNVSIGQGYTHKVFSLRNTVCEIVSNFEKLGDFSLISQQEIVKTRTIVDQSIVFMRVMMTFINDTEERITLESKTFESLGNHRIQILGAKVKRMQSYVQTLLFETEMMEQRLSHLLSKHKVKIGQVAAAAA